MRICDTRANNPSGPSGTAAQCSEGNTGALLAAAGTLTVQATGLAGIPGGAAAVVVNLTAIDPSAQTYLSVHPGPTQPTISDINPGANDVAANLVVARLSASGTITISNHSGSVNLAVDVMGWHSATTD